LLVDIKVSNSLTNFLSFSVVILSTSCIWLITTHPSKKLTQLQQAILHHGIGSILFLFSLGILLLDFLSAPAHAQFFQGAESWMTGVFPDASTVIPLIFNVLRGLFLLYLGIALVKVINAAREDEDWKQLARTPLIILIAVTMGDVLAGLIIGNGTPT
ncbi:MAG: hypothetical protein WA919_20430, partial [Coleofasciculaceae cyanobacterium]